MQPGRGREEVTRHAEEESNVRGGRRVRSRSMLRLAAARVNEDSQLISMLRRHELEGQNILQRSRLRHTDLVRHHGIGKWTQRSGPRPASS
jgi:hypothetical protein